ncbi:MAG: HEAT repeat domain-containing protein [Gemmatimonadota bacterium]|nr:MAG: HEAT repeat domain-containing protein [Gemmatimonadota bacterium]
MEPVGPDPHESASLRELAALPQLSERERAPVLERLFRDPSPDVRQAAVRMGAMFLQEDAVVAYLRNDSDDVLRNAAAEMLKHCGPRSVAIARLLLHDRDKDVVLQAIVLLRHFRDAGAIGPLRQLLGHTDPNVVQSAILALGRVGHAGVAADLLPFLNRELWLQMAAVEALGELRSQVAVESLARLLADPMLGGLAADALSRIGGTEAFSRLGGFLVMGDCEARDRLEQLAGAIEGCDEPAPPVDGLAKLLGGCLCDSDNEARTASARCLLAIGPSEWDAQALEALATNCGSAPMLPGCLRRRPDLIPRLLSAGGIQRRWGFRLAEEYPTRVPADVLAQALATTREHEHFEAAAGALMAAGDAAVEQLPRLYGRLPATVRTSWAPVVARFRRGIARSALEDPDVDPSARRVLEVALEEDPSAVASKLLELRTAEQFEAMAHLVDRPDVLRALPWSEWLCAAPQDYGSYAVVHAGTADLATHLPAIRECLRTQAHRDLIRLVGRLRDEESVPLLVDLITSENEELIPFALAALGSIGGDAAREALRGYCTADWAWARFAYRAFAECAMPTDLGPFRAGVDHEDWHVRMTCASVLRKADQAADKPRLAVLSADPVSAVATAAMGNGVS